jgi:hypothetical protein
MADATDLHTLAEEFLFACADSLNMLSAPLAGVPDRAFVAPNLVADDCEQLVTYVGGIAEKPGSTDTHNQSWINQVTLVGRIVRCCFPMGTMDRPPTAAEWAAVSEQTDADAWVLWNHLHNLIRAGSLFSTCPKQSWDSMRPIPVSGACGGWIVQVRAELDGFADPVIT